MATVTQLKSGRWQALARKKYHKPVYKTFLTKAMADKWATRTEDEIERGVLKDARDRPHDHGGAARLVK